MDHTYGYSPLTKWDDPPWKAENSAVLGKKKKNNSSRPTFTNLGGWLSMMGLQHGFPGLQP